MGIFFHMMLVNVLLSSNRYHNFELKQYAHSEHSSLYVTLDQPIEEECSFQMQMVLLAKVIVIGPNEQHICYGCTVKLLLLTLYVLLHLNYTKCQRLDFSESPVPSGHAAPRGLVYTVTIGI